jgi:hypothetical protein
MLGAVTALSPPQNANAQRLDRPQIIVAPTVVAVPGSKIPLAIQVGPLQTLPRNSFIRLRGLPHSVSLSEGHSIGPGSWAIPLNTLPTLKANVPAGESGQSDLVIHLMTIDGTVLAEARTELVVSSDTPGYRGLATEAEAPVSRQDRSVPAARARELSVEDRTRAQKFLALGDECLRQGNVAGARLFFRRAAEVGYALGALRLGATYDPAELRRLEVQGVPADRAEARKWYERARELGATEASEYLARLGGG